MTHRQRKYVNERSKGKNKRQAALAAGYAPSTALRVKQHIETPEVRAAFAAVIRKQIPPEKIARRIKEGLDAKETQFFQRGGIVTDSREAVSWAERRQYAALAAEFGGYHVPAVEVTGSITHELTEREKQEAVECVARILEYEEKERKLLKE